VQKPPRTTRLLRYYLFRTRRLSRRQLGTLNDWKLRAVFWVGAILVGVVVQLFAWAADFSAHQFDLLREWNVYAPLVVTPLGLVMIVWLMNHSSPAARGSGIPQVLVVLKQRYKWLRPTFLSIRVVLAKFALTCFGLMCGGSLGREGPSVHIGAALMHQVGRWGRLEDKYVDNALIVAGGAAGVSAAFNAPLAGVVFAIEELSQSFEQRTTGTLIVAIILSGVVVLAMAGHYSFFGQPEPQLILIDYWLQIIATAVLCGLLGGLFVWLLMRGSLMLAPQVRKHPYRVALACGLLVALIGFLSGGITFGSGYDEARALIEQKDEPGLLFPLAKMASTLLTYFTGVPGGLFSPSLATGAGIGAFMGHLFQDTSVVGVTLVGMAAFLAGVTQRPITAFVIVMELTGNHHEMLLSLMAAAFIATAVAKLVHPTPVFDSLAHALAEGRALPVEGAETAAPKAQKKTAEAG
jgi:H+/Cl- antiporter ClcA